MTSTSARLEDDELFRLLQERLFTAVIGDVLDQMGYLRQFLPPEIAPLDPAMKIAGRAMPVLGCDIFEDESKTGRGPLSAKKFGLMFEALDDLKRGEIYVATGCSPAYALWGELMTMRAMHLQAAGGIFDGYIRDGSQIQAMGFPAFSRGLYARDQGPRGKVVDFRCAIEIGGVRIEPGTLMFGDREGVLVIPREAEHEAVARALEKTEAESRVADAIRGGMPTVEAFAKFGVM